MVPVGWVGLGKEGGMSTMMMRRGGEGRGNRVERRSVNAVHAHGMQALVVVSREECLCKG